GCSRPKVGSTWPVGREARSPDCEANLLIAHATPYHAGRPRATGPPPTPDRSRPRNLSTRAAPLPLASRRPDAIHKGPSTSYRHHRRLSSGHGTLPSPPDLR